MIAKYNAVIPGLGDRLVRMAEEEAAHRRSVEIEVVQIQGRDQKAYRLSELLGQIFGLAIGLSAILGAVHAATHGAQWAGSFIGTAGVTGLVSAFILGRRYLGQQKEQEFQHRMEAPKHQDEKPTAGVIDGETPDAQE